MNCKWTTACVFYYEPQMDWFECLVTVFKWIKHEKDRKKMKTEKAEKLRKPVKIFA